jgi:hypothetical protein
MPGTTTRELVVKFLGEASGLQETVKQVADATGAAAKSADDAGERQSKAWDKAKVAAGVAAAALTGFAVKFGSDSINAYMEAEQAQAQFNDQMARVPGMTAEAQAGLEDYASALSKKTVYDDDATKSAMATLSSFGLTADQIKTMTPLVQDYATKTGKDLVTAATDLGKAGDGQAKALKAIGINFKSTGDDAADFAAITQLLQDKVGGLAVATGDTAAGKVAILKNQFGEVQETVGSQLVPILSKLLGVAVKVFSWLADNTDVVKAIAIAVGILVVAIYAVNAALWILAANPVTLIIIGIAAAVALLAVGFVLLWSRCETFRDIVTAVFEVVGAVASWLWNNVLWPIIQLWLLQFVLMWKAAQTLADVVVAVFHAIADAVSWAWDNVISPTIDAIVRAWQWLSDAAGSVARGVRDAWNSMVDGIRTAYDWISGKIEDLVSLVTGLPGRIASAASGMWDWLTSGFRTAWNTVVGWWNGIHFPTITIGEVDLGPLGHFGGASFGGWSVPQLPTLDRGGIVTGPTLAKLAMNSKPEAIIPLSELPNGGTNISVTVNVPATANPAETGREVSRVLRAFVSAGGRIPVNP